MSHAEPLEAPEQAAWDRLGAPDRFDVLLDALRDLPGVGLDPHRRLRLARALVELARRGVVFNDWRDAANVVVPLIALSPEAREGAATALRAHWGAGAAAAEAAPPRAIGAARWLGALGLRGWLALLAALLLAAALAAAALYPPTRIAVPPAQVVVFGAERAATFWKWLASFYRDDLMYRVNAALCVVAVGVMWWREQRGEQKRQLRRERRAGRAANALHVPTPTLLRAAAVRRAGRLLRRPLKIAGWRLDLRRSVEATVAACGFPTPVYLPARRTPDCLMLIDRESRDDQLTAIAEALAKRLRDGGAEVYRYEFRGAPDVLEAVGRKFGGAAVLSLDALARRHAGARIVVVNDGRGFLQPGGQARLRRDPRLFGPPVAAPFPGAATRDAGPPRPRILPDFAERPILLTPTPPDKWGPAEATLSAVGFSVTPLAASEDAQLGLFAAAEALSGGRAAPAIERRVEALATPGADPLFDLLERADLMSDLPPPNAELRLRVAQEIVAFAAARVGEAGEGPPHEDFFCPDPFAATGMLGVAALALFPRIEPALTFALWEAATGYAPGLERLSRLARLPWFRAAYMPDWLRADVARHVQGALEHSGEGAKWLQLKEALRSFAENALRGDAQGRGLPVFAPTPDAAWRRLFHLLRDQASPAPRDVIEERLFLTFLETGAVVDDELSIVMPRADRPTLAMRLGLVGFVLATLIAAAIAPWLVGVVAAATQPYFAGMAFKESSVALAALAAGALAPLSLAAGFIAALELRPRWFAGAGVAGAAAMIFGSQLLVLIDVKQRVIESGVVAFDIVVAAPFAAIAAMLHTPGPRFDARASLATMFLSVVPAVFAFHEITRPDYSGDMQGIVLAYFVVSALALITTRAENSCYCVNFPGAPRLFVIALFVPTLCGVTLATLAFARGTSDAYAQIGNLGVYIVVSSVVVAAPAFIFSDKWRLRAAFTLMSLTIIALFCFERTNPYVSAMSFIATGYAVARAWNVRRAMVAPFDAHVFETEERQARLSARSARTESAAQEQASSGTGEEFFLIKVTSSLFVQTVKALRVIEERCAIDVAQTSSLKIYFQIFISANFYSLISMIAMAVVIAELSLVMDVTRLTTGEASIGGLLGNVTTLYFTSKTLIFGGGAFLIALTAYQLFPDDAADAAAQTKIDTRSDLFVLLALWVVTLLPENLDAINALLPPAAAHILPATKTTPMLCWIAVPLALWFVAERGQRLRTLVLLGLAPFAAPLDLYGVHLPGGFWALGLVYILAEWMARPERVDWLRAPKPTPFIDMLMAPHGGLFLPPIIHLIERFEDWRARPLRLAAERLALAGAAAVFVLLLAPRVSMIREAWDMKITLIDAQPLRAALFFLLGATPLRRWPVRAAFIAWINYAAFIPGAEQPLGDTHISLQLALGPYAAWELWFAYEIPVLARWLWRMRAPLRNALALFCLLLTLSLLQWLAPEAGHLREAPVALALVGLACGLMMHRSAPASASEFALVSSRGFALAASAHWLNFFLSSPVDAARLTLPGVIGLFFPANGIGVFPESLILIAFIFVGLRLHFIAVSPLEDTRAKRADALREVHVSRAEAP